MADSKATSSVSRRVLLRGLGATVAMAPLGRVLAACGNGSSAATAADSGANAIDAAGIPWATGGTASMTSKASYPDPFSGATPSTCVVTCPIAQGPCWDSTSETMKDISYGQNGLPMQMMLQILDDACKPVTGAVVDVWHVAPTGKYSGDDTANEQVAFCTGNDADYMSHLYFRGKQTTDAHGIVTFDSCFPGWYSGRTVHVHVNISVGSNAYLTTQLLFEDALDDEIIGAQPIYDARGKRDTTNTTDGVLAESMVTKFLFATQKMPDGAMLAYKTIVIRSSLSTDLSGQCGGVPMGGPTLEGGAGMPPLPDAGPG